MYLSPTGLNMLLDVAPNSLLVDPAILQRPRNQGNDLSQNPASHPATLIEAATHHTAAALSGHPHTC
ncbi:MAG: hypothetical protein ACREDR_34820 [Blastocatellia bacterium]